jgi:hypothetical protein
MDKLREICPDRVLLLIGFLIDVLYYFHLKKIDESACNLERHIRMST